MALVASNAQSLRISVDAINFQGRGAGGVAGMKLKGEACVVGAGAVVSDGVVVVATDLLGLKATALEEIPSKGRGGQGVRLTKLTDGETLTLAWFGSLPVRLLAQMTDDGDSRKIDPIPEAIYPYLSGRDLVPGRTERQIRVIALARW